MNNPNYKLKRIYSVYLTQTNYEKKIYFFNLDAGTVFSI